MAAGVLTHAPVPVVPARRRRLPWALVAVGTVVAVAVLLPLAFLLLQASQVGWAQLSSLLFRQLTATLLWNTVRLAVIVTVLCGIIGVAAAWCTERTALPGRRFWVVALVLPLAVPDFVLGYSWVSVAPWVSGLFGATLIMTLGSYPLVYLPVAAALRGSDVGLEEVARSAGMGPWRTFRKVTFHQIRPAMLGGCLLVTLLLLAEYGTFEIVRFQTFTTEIYNEFQVGFDTQGACALSLVLVVLGLVALTGEAMTRGRAGAARRRETVGSITPVRLGRAAGPVLGGLGLLLALAIGLPCGVLVYWMVHGGSSTLPPASLVGCALDTAGYSAAAAVLATAAALPIALLVERHRNPGTLVMERATFVVQALPGLVIALSLVYFTTRYFPSIYQSSAELVVAYAIMFFPLALVAVRGSVAQAPTALDEVARSLGHGRLSVFRRVDLPLVAPGLVASFCLVFITAGTELTATLVLHPTGVETLATQFWSYTTDFSYASAAPYAAVLLLVAALPGALLGRWFQGASNRGSDR